MVHSQNAMYAVNLAVKIYLRNLPRGRAARHPGACAGSAVRMQHQCGIVYASRYTLRR